METRRSRGVLRWKIQVIIKKNPTKPEICRHTFSMETLETTPTWIMLAVSGHGEVWRVLFASLSRERAALCLHGSLHTAGSPWPGWHCHTHGTWGIHRGHYQAKCSCPQLLCCQQWLFCLIISCFLIDHVKLPPPGIRAAATGLCVSEFLWEA